MDIVDLDDVKLENGEKVVIKESFNDPRKILTRENLFLSIHFSLILLSLVNAYLFFMYPFYEFGFNTIFFGIMGFMSFFRKREIYYVMHILYSVFLMLFATYLFFKIRSVDLGNPILMLTYVFYGFFFSTVNYLMFYLICKAHDILLKELQ